MKELSTEIIKSYVSDWHDIMGSIEAEYMSTRRMKKYIAKKWNVPFDYPPVGAGASRLFLWKFEDFFCGRRSNI